MSKKGMLCALFVLVLCSMLALAISGKSRFPLINKVVATVVMPIENALVAIGNTGDNIRGYWRALTVLQSENKELKKKMLICVMPTWRWRQFTQKTNNYVNCSTIRNSTELRLLVLLR